MQGIFAAGMSATNNRTIVITSRIFYLADNNYWTLTIAMSSTASTYQELLNLVLHGHPRSPQIFNEIRVTDVLISFLCLF
jgi:hypothetical protein